jgi:hypothetical protein
MEAPVNSDGAGGNRRALYRDGTDGFTQSRRGTLLRSWGYSQMAVGACYSHQAILGW